MILNSLFSVITLTHTLYMASHTERTIDTNSTHILFDAIFT